MAKWVYGWEGHTRGDDRPVASREEVVEILVAMDDRRHNCTMRAKLSAYRGRGRVRVVLKDTNRWPGTEHGLESLIVMCQPRAEMTSDGEKADLRM